MKLILDTNTYVAFMSGDSRALRLVREADVIGLPVPVIAELRFGFRNGSRTLENERSLRNFLQSPRVVTLQCDEQTTNFYADFKVQLKKQGTPIPINDVWIAALVNQHLGVLYSFDSDFDHLPQLPRVR